MKVRFLLIATIFSSSFSYSQLAYKLGPDSRQYDKIPSGSISQHNWVSKIYPNTSRDYYLYVPDQYKAEEPAALMVFQDGHAYVQEDGNFRVPTVFDNLISQGKMPVTIGLFVNPGHDVNLETPENPWRASNRSVEYDEVSDTYARFLTEELIPEIKKSYNISDDPAMRAVCGLSSGGICAFSAAWFNPDQFQKVLSHIGSFTNIRGGHNYPSMIRNSDKKNIKVYLQDGKNDLDNKYGNWWLANLQMEAALKYKGYEYKFDAGDGGHDGKHGGSILPQSLIWLWSDVLPQKLSSGVYHSPNDNAAHKMFSGETRSLSEMLFESFRIIKKDGVINLTDKGKEQILIVKSGELEIRLRNGSKVIGPNSVLILLPGEEGSISALTPDAGFFKMSYISRENPEVQRGMENGSSGITDYKELTFTEHDKGGIRNYFRRSTAMCSYYEMHMTNLNPGIKSHEPHVHRADEIIIMIEGETEMEIGNEVFIGRAGDVYYVSSNTPHAIRNTGTRQCQYFAFQWE